MLVDLTASEIVTLLKMLEDNRITETYLKIIYKNIRFKLNDALGKKEFESNRDCLNKYIPLKLPSLFAKHRLNRNLPIGKGRFTRQFFIVEYISNEVLEDYINDLKEHLEIKKRGEKIYFGLWESAVYSIRRIEQWKGLNNK